MSSSGSTKPQRDTGASQRASEITSAMLNVPGYADDSMLFMMRYGAMAEETLRKVDWAEFTVRLAAMNSHWFESKSSVGCSGTGEGDGAKLNTAAPEAAAAAAASSYDFKVSEHEVEPGSKAAELKARTLELIEDFPRLVRDFDKFVECTRMAAARYKR
ncbi:hypothetical protein V8C37DRAFT_309771 [Trichoderma ceciliae]